MYKKNLATFYLALALCPFLKTEDLWQVLKKTSKLNPHQEYSFIQLLKLCKISYDFIYQFDTWLRKFNLNYHKLRLKKEDIKLLTANDKRYPQSLKEIYDAPPFLFYKGDINILENNYELIIAVVGSRKNTSLAQKTIDSIIGPLCLKKNILIISGLAYGVDSLAHNCALKYNTKTIAILGSGLYQESIYPQSNLSLANNIIRQEGLLLSEFPPNEPPKSKNFPRRNRLVAALAKTVLIVEAELRSGALITARLALEQNKDVLAIPGNIFCSNYIGTNRLIQAGAYPILSYQDILDYYLIIS